MSRYLKAALVFIGILLIVSCEKSEKTDGTKQEQTDIEELRKEYEILRFANQKNAESLKNLVENGDTSVSTKALYALIPLSDTSAMYWFAGYLDSPERALRQASAYALGVLKNPYAAPFLMKRYKKEKDINVKAQIIKALGQCGDYKAMQFVASLPLDISKTDQRLLLAQAQAMATFNKRGKKSKVQTDRQNKLLFSQHTSTEIKRAASLFFSYPNTEIADINDKIIELYNTSQDQIIKYNLIKSLKNNPTEQNLKFLVSQLDNSTSALIKTGIVDALRAYDYKQTKNHIITLLNDKSPIVAYAAASYFVYNGKQQDSKLYFELAKGAKNWQARSLMLKAAIKYSTNKENFTKYVISGYSASENSYEKASLLAALAEDPSKFEFIKDEILFTDQHIISTTAMAALVRLRFSKKFEQYLNKNDLLKEYKILLKELMKRGDNALIYYAAKALNSDKTPMIDQYENLSYINTALARLLLPKDIKSYTEVCKLASKYLGTNCINPDSMRLSFPDIETFTQAASLEKVIVKTSKGNFIVQLDKKSPVARAFTYQLILEHYYNNIRVFRIIPGQTVELSSRRGDNWPDKNIAFASELHPHRAQAGNVYLAPLADNTNSTRWLITTSEVDYSNKLTLLGSVIQGLDVVKKLEAGDTVYSIEIFQMAQ